MKIVYLHDELYPSTSTDTQQVMKNLEALGAAGADVTLSLPRFPQHWLIGRAEWARRLRQHYGVQETFALCGLPCPIPYSRLRAEKLYHAALGPAVSLLRGQTLLYSRNLPAIVVGMALGRTCLYETYKPLPRSNPRLFALLQPYLLHPRFMGIVTHSNYARAAFVEAGVPPAKVVTLHNGYDPEALRLEQTAAQARQALGLPLRGFVVGYAGNLQPSKNLPYLLQIIARVPEATLLVVGGRDDHRRALERQAQQRAPGQVVFAGWVRASELGPYLYACDVLAIPPSTRGFAQVGDAVLPMKLFQYLAAGRALYLPDLPDTVELVVHQLHGLRSPPDQLEQNVADLRWLLEHPVQAAAMGARGKATAAGLTWAARGVKLRQFIEARLATED